MVRVGRAQSGSLPGSLPGEPGCGDDLWEPFPPGLRPGFPGSVGGARVCARVPGRGPAAPGQVVPLHKLRCQRTQGLIQVSPSLFCRLTEEGLRFGAAEEEPPLQNSSRPRPHLPFGAPLSYCTCIFKFLLLFFFLFSLLNYHSKVYIYISCSPFLPTFPIPILRENH